MRASGAPAGLLADLDAPFLGPSSVANHGISGEAWLVAVKQAALAADLEPVPGPARTHFVAVDDDHGQPKLLVLHGESGRWRTLALAFGGSASDPAVRRAISEALERPPPAVHPSIALLDGIGRQTGLPFALLEKRELAWANLALWSAMGLTDGAQLGSAFLSPKTLLISTRIEAAARGELSLPGLVLSPLPNGAQLVQAADPEEKLRAARFDRLVRTWGLTLTERHELTHILQGRPSKEAARLDEVSPDTIRERRRRIYKKAGVGGAGPLRALLGGLS
ncbi:hypothetical protein AKJ08_2303 [Vulgatibacter incomptus]|uniref:HTH luxR-type domain-containing protein n=2 Tax=Vulgatibacter incomptus TaxID=1391653 RepID=A0A0K1PES4_9BACT|nr:hypothetical protein AKJ08_2303 [Vulgatibacter incomptus]